MRLTAESASGLHFAFKFVRSNFDYPAVSNEQSRSKSHAYKASETTWMLFRFRDRFQSSQHTIKSKFSSNQMTVTCFESAGREVPWLRRSYNYLRRFARFLENKQSGRRQIRAELHSTMRRNMIFAVIWA